MSQITAENLSSLQAVTGQLVVSEFRGQTRVVVPKEQLGATLQWLHGHGFDYLIDVTCVDYLAYREAENRFGLVYQLASTTSGERVTLRTYVNDPEPTVVSATAWWTGADWLEREVYDLFGILFEGHPDLRRIVLPEEFTAHPLRKDYPLQGRGERHNFDRLSRGSS